MKMGAMTYWSPSCTPASSRAHLFGAQLHLEVYDIGELLQYLWLQRRKYIWRERRKKT
jgi:hypothetical protein